MKQVCYRDEKMYGPPQEGTSKEELEAKIRELELKIYGCEASKLAEAKAHKSVIYDVEAKGFVEYDEFIKTERGKRLLKDTEER